MAVFVLDKQGKPLMPCSEKRARLLLSRGRARVHRVVPFVIRLVDRLQSESALQPVAIKLDPGSKTTGVAVVRIKEETDEDNSEIRNIACAISLMELVHRGKQISKSLTARRAFRRRRRSQHLRHRQARFDNRTKPEGWLPPSLQHRVDATVSLVKRLRRWAPATGIQQELVRFDTHAMQNPDIAGIEYQQGELAGYEVREYLLEAWSRQCAYCDAKEVPLEIEHIIAKSQGGTDRVSNLTLACRCCNQKKGALPIQQFVKDPARLARILAHAKAPLKDAAAVNAARWALFSALTDTGLSVACSSGGRTKYNRRRFNIPKTHALDALCVGDVDGVECKAMPTLSVQCAGRGSYQRTRLTKHGFPRSYLMRTKAVYGFQTGDLVKANVAAGKKMGCYVGRVAVRASGAFNIQTTDTVIQGVSWKYCRVIQRGDGYGYHFHNNVTGLLRKPAIRPLTKVRGVLAEDL